MNEEIKENKKIKQSGKYIFKKHNLNFYPNNNILNNYTNTNANLCTKYIKTNISEKTLKHTFTNSNSYFNNINIANKNLKIDINHNNNNKYKNNTNGNLLCNNNSKNYENKFLIKRNTNTNIPFNKMNLNNIKKKRLKTISISMKIDKSKSFIKNIKHNENINEMKKSLNLYNIKDKKRDLTPSLLKRMNAKKNNTINTNNINMNNINTNNINNFNHNYNRHMSGDFVNIFRITEECKQQKNNDNRNILDNIPYLNNINKIKLPMIDYRNKIKNNSNNNKNNDEEYFEYKKESIIELTKEEKEIYGNRCMKGYIKKKLLGKGGYGIVWLCQKNKNFNKNNVDYREYAVKQTYKKNNLNLNIARNEIKNLIALNKRSNDEENKNDKIGYELIPKIYNIYEDNNDIWFHLKKEEFLYQI